jgi:Zn-dependent M28 family amino/carboxypeptidase
VGPADETGDSIYSGADDNASGTAALIQMAEAFAALPEAPARSVLFLAVSGEEKGLLGSAYFAQNPTVPRGSMVANLNLDMVGRNHPDTVYAIGKEYSDLGDLVREVAAAHPELGLVVAPDPEPEEQVFLRSDHFSFVQVGIPALMFTTWLHDEYHAPSDTPDLIDAEKLARVARLSFLLVHRLAQDETVPEWNAAGRELLRSLSLP